MKNVYFITVFLLCALTFAVLSGCTPDNTDIISVDDEGNTSIDQTALEQAINQEATQQLTEKEKEGIIFMREEEKLARDVYSQLYDKWGVNSFNNIGSSEQTHMDAVASLIQRYGLSDPVQGKETGEFTDQTLQQLHDELIEQGSKSEIDALKVGAAIEEIDILDLEEYLAETGKQDITTVYESLQKGSRNHLRSFVSVMQKRGLDYEPQYLPEEQFNDIVSASVERGKN